MLSKNQIVAKINKEIGEVRVQGLLKSRPESLEEFLIKFFNKWNVSKPTLTVKDGKVQTPAGKRRSLGDVYKICKYYYPNCTLEEVTGLIYDKLFDKIPNFRTSYCKTQKKRMFYKGTSQQESGIYDINKKDEFDATIEDWEDSL